MKEYSIEDISRSIDGTLEGNSKVQITGLEEIAEAKENQLTFIGEKKYANMWAESGASAAIINQNLDIDPGEGRALVRVADADLAMAQVLEMFEPALPECETGTHTSAVVDATAEIGKGVAIGAGCYIGPRVVIGDNTKLYPNVTILDDSAVGSDTTIWSGTVIRERCRVGSHCILHPNVTVGADGFGYRPSADGKRLVKIPHVGTVTIGDGVEIGAGSCVDRGKFSATSIGDGSKIDNLIQIAHNCRLGRSVIMAGQSGLAGSVTLGNGVMMGGGARVKDHVVIGDGVKIGGNAGVIKDLKPGQVVTGFPADDYRQVLKQWAAQKHLPDLVKLMKKKNRSS